MIKEWRIKSNLTQQELGEKAGLAKRTVGSIERGDRAPTKWEIVKLCQALGKTPAELLTISYRSFLNELNEIGKLQDSSKPLQPERGIQSAPDSGSKVNQIIDQMAALAKELYHESKADFQKVFLDWLAQPGPADSSPSPRGLKKRVRRRRGSAKE